MTAGRATVLAASAALAMGLGLSAAPARAWATDPAPAAETDQQRRDRLNARLAEMVRSGEGARLSQPSAPPRDRRAGNVRRRAPSAVAPPATPPPPVSDAAAWPTLSSASAATPIAPTPITATPVSTFAPPAYIGGASASVPGRYYTPPTLDLTTPPRVPTDPIECLTHALYYEARNESEEGQAAVAEVVLNRTRSGLYPSSVCAVVYQRNSRTCQFTFTCDGAIGRHPVDMVKWARAERIAREVMEERRPAILPPTSVNYHASYVSPSWGRRLQRVRQIGTHIFYGAPIGGGSTPGAQTASVAAPPPRQGGLVFVRNEALERAYQERLAANGGTAATSVPGATTTAPALARP